MNLGEILRDLVSSPDDGTIIAEAPWAATSRAGVRVFDVSTPVSDMATDGMTYFLEVSVALEVRDGLTAAGWCDEEALCKRIIIYAINDA
jgi:hypothetical protein